MRNDARSVQCTTQPEISRPWPERMRATSRCRRGRRPVELWLRAWWSEPWWKPTAPEFPWEKEFRAANRLCLGRARAVLAPLRRVSFFEQLRLGRIVQHLSRDSPTKTSLVEPEKK